MRQLNIIEVPNGFKVECIEKPRTRYKTCKNLKDVIEFVKEELGEKSGNK